MNATVHVDLQIAGDATGLPTLDEIRDWLQRTVCAALPADRRHFEISVRIVDEAESRQLNNLYRQLDKPTNVLAFPAASDIGFVLAPRRSRAVLGDLVICGRVVRREAREQGKAVAQHWVHMLVHGTLHLLGFDHGTDDEAQCMEGLETRILASRGIDDPYAPAPQT